MNLRAFLKSTSPFIVLVITLYFLITWLLIADKQNDMEWVYVSEILVTIITIVTVVAAVNKVNFLHLLNNRQDLLLENSPAKNVMYDFKKDALYISNDTAELLGLQNKRRLKLPKFLKIFNDIDQAEIDYIVSKSKLSTQFSKVGLVKVEGEESDKFLQYSCQLMIDRFGNKLLSFWFMDYTGVVKDELELVGITKRYRIASFELHQILDIIPFPIWRRNVDGQIVFHNHEFEPLLQKYNLDMEDQSMIGIHQDALKNSEVKYQTKKFILPNGIDSLSFFEVPTQDRTGTIGYCIDISEQEKQLASVKTLESLLGKLIDNISVGLISLDREERITKHNTAFINLFALDPALLDKRPNYRYVLEVMREHHKLPELKGFKEKHLQDIREVRDYKVDLLHAPNGSTIKITIIPSKDGHTIITFENLTPNLEIERELNKTKLMLHSVIGLIGDPVLIVSQNGQINYINKQFINAMFVDSSQNSAPAHISQLFATNILKIDQSDITSMQNIILNCLESKHCASHTFDLDGAKMQCETLGLDDLSVLLIVRKLAK